MSDLLMRSKRINKMLFITIGVFLVGYIVTDFKTIFAGLVLGSLLSTFNVTSIARETYNLGNRAASLGEDEEEEASSILKKLYVGPFLRFLLVGMGTWLAVNLDQYINVYAFLIGLLVSYVAMIIDYVFAVDKFAEEKEER